MMTRDAKSGLLLGFILIVAIVFAVNGLPKFLKDKMPACASATDHHNSQIIIPNKSSEDLMVIAKNTARNMVSSQEQQVELKIPESAKPVPQPVKTVGLPAAAQQINAVDNAAVAVEPKQTKQADVNHKVYTVKPKDTLATIAKQFYGSDEGNRIANIEKIAKYNSLKSSNSIYQGQELKIPHLQAFSQTGDFIQVQNYQPNQSSKVKTAEPVLVPENPKQSAKKSVKKYTIQEGDTLWSVASRTLGGGKRYSEILKLNSSLDGSKPLKLGTVIILPD